MSSSPSSSPATSRFQPPRLDPREAVLRWERPPSRIALVKKWRDLEARDAAITLGDWLLATYSSLTLVVIEDESEEDDDARFPSRFTRYACLAGADYGADLDVIVTVGGDGTVLHVSGLFPGAMPPVVAVACGSLGFMTVHSIESGADVLMRMLTAGDEGGASAGHAPTQDITVQSPPSPAPAAPSHTTATPLTLAWLPSPLPAGSIPVSLRLRLRVDVHRFGCARDAPPEVTRVVLNELLLERGRSPYMATLNASVDGEHLTTVAADGLIVATQTGSTAYSLSAGGSILSPATAAIVFTPICPHTLSFRPLLFPDSAVLRLEVPRDARSSAWCSFDGRHSMELRGGDYVTLRASDDPLPLVAHRSAMRDWVLGIKNKLYWNVRERQRSFRRAGAAALGGGGGKGAQAALESAGAGEGGAAGDAAARGPAQEPTAAAGSGAPALRAGGGGAWGSGDGSACEGSGSSHSVGDVSALAGIALGAEGSALAAATLVAGSQEAGSESICGCGECRSMQKGRGADSVVRLSGAWGRETPAVPSRRASDFADRSRCASDAGPGPLMQFRGRAEEEGRR